MGHNYNEKIQNVLDSEGINYTSDDDYSGRGMYGATCTAFTLDRDELRVAEGELTKRDVSYRVDNMGRDYVIY